MVLNDAVTNIAVGLGSNLDDRRRLLRSGLGAIDGLRDTSVEAVSSLYQTEPRIVEDQPAFLNACATVATKAEPHEMLDRCQSIERDHGRERTRRKGPRRLDLDILLWEDRIIESCGLTIPHPGLGDRAFVLVPLAEIAPGAVDPRTEHTVRQLLEACPDDGDVERVSWWQ